jgi:hypothetical protein
MVESELFSSQMAELDAEVQGLIWRSLNRAREGRPTPGVEKPWEGDWLLWPCGDHHVLLRPMTEEEVAAVTGAPQKGILLIAIEPSPF